MVKIKWYTIPRFPKYEINEMLQVRHKVKLKIKSCYLSDGYLKLNIQGNNCERHKPYLHQIVANTFVPNPENKTDVHHIDEDKLNNQPNNLMWVTPAEHRQISKQNEQISHKISVKDVVYIRDNYSEKNKFKLAAQFNVRPITIYNIAIGTARVDIIGGKISEPTGVYKKIVNIETNEIFSDARVLSKKIGWTIRKIRRTLSGERYNDTPYRYLGSENIIKERPIVEKQKSPIGLFDMDWNFIRRYEYKSELAAFLNTDTSRINEFLRGQCEFIRKYKVKEIDDEGNFIEPTPFISKRPPLKPKKIKQAVTPPKPIIRYNLDGVEVQRYNSVSEAAKQFNIDKRSFRNAIRRSPNNFTKGFIWKYGN